MSIWSRSVIVLLCGLLLLTISIAVLNTLVPLWLAQDSMPTWQVGIVSSAFYTGNLAGTLLSGWMIKQLGFNRSYYLATAVFAVASMALGIQNGFIAWSLWRFVAGIGCALIWMVVESALLCSGTVRNRGRLLACYMMIYYLGTVIGQLMLSKLPGELIGVLTWVTALLAAAILPVIFVKITAHSNEQDVVTESMWTMMRRRHSRLGVNGCIISGIVLGSLYGLMPLYLSKQGMSSASIGHWMALLVSAGIIGQWPIGWLADRLGRLLVLRVQVFVIILGAVAMLSDTSMATALFILGCAGFTLYPVAMSWACQTVSHQQLVPMNQALLLSYTTGSLIGPATAAMLMQNYSDSLLFVMIALVALVYLVMLLRKADHHVTPVAHA